MKTIRLTSADVHVEVAVWTPTAGKRFRLRGGVLSASIAGNYIFRDGLAGPIVFVLPLTAGPAGLSFQLPEEIGSEGINNALTCTGPANLSAISGQLYGSEQMVLSAAPGAP